MYTRKEKWRIAYDGKERKEENMIEESILEKDEDILLW